MRQHRDHRFRWYSHFDAWVVGVTLVLTPVYYLFPWGLSADLRAVFGVPYIFLYAVLLPGLVLAPRIAGRLADALARIAVSALFGLAWFMAVAFVWALADLSLGLLHAALPVLVVLTVGLAFLKKPEPDVGELGPVPWDRGRRKIAPPSRGASIALAVFAVFLAAIFALVLRSGPPLQFRADTLDHVGYVAEIAETQLPFPNTEFYKDPGADGADLRKGLLHVFYGFSTGYLRIEPLTLLTWMNALFAALFLLSVYGSALLLFGNRAVAVLSAVLFLVALDEGLRGTGIRQSLYTHRFGIVFFLFFLVHGLRYTDTGKRRELLPAVVFSFGAIATHVFFGVLIVFVGLTMLVWKFCFPQNEWNDHLRRVVRLGLAVFLGIVPYGLFRYITAYPGANELHKDVQGVVFITEHLYITDPIREFEWFGLVGLLSFFTIFSLWNHRDKNAGIGYAYASFFTWGAILLNPILLPPIRGALTYLIARLNFLCPFYFIAAYFLVAFFRRPNREMRRSPAGLVVAALLGLAILSDVFPVFRTNTFSAGQREKSRRESYLLWEDALEVVDGALPPGSVIASDPLTSYSVTAFTPYHTISTFDQHAPPNDTRLAERMQAARDILSPFVPIDRTAALLAEQGATHVIVNDRFRSDVRLEYWGMSRTLAPAIREKFDRRPGTFDLVYDEEGFTVFRWNGGTPVPDSSLAVPFFRDTIPESWTPVGKLAGVAVLEGVRLDSATVAPGGAIDLGFAWSGRGDYDFRNYAVVVRFDYTDPGLALGGWPFPKIARKFKEKAVGHLYRFTDFHKVGNGFLSPDTWPPGEIVLDETTIPVPKSAAPGEYVVSVKFLILQHQATYRLGDIFSDDDVYAGLPVGRITVR